MLTVARFMYPNIYDYRNRLIEVDNVASGNAIAQYVYDGMNRRVKKDLETGTDVVYIYDGWQLIEEREEDAGAWQARRQFVYGTRYIDEVLFFDNDTDEDGNCAEAGDDTRYLYCQDANYNVMALTDIHGAPVERYIYDPYGVCTVTLDNASGNPYRFQGRRYDEETGLYYFRNRYYHPTLGRFLQRDPAGYVERIGLYEFVRSLPTSLVDPYGLQVLTQEEIDEAIELAKKKAKWYLTFGTDLASRLFRHWMEGSGQTYYLDPKDVAKIVGTSEAQAGMATAKLAIMGRLYEIEAPLGEWKTVREVVIRDIKITYVKPETVLDRSDRADLFYSFHDLWLDGSFHGRVCREDGKKLFVGTFQYLFHDKYIFANRRWQAIPGDPEATDRIFWIWQTYGTPAPFRVQGLHVVEEEHVFGAPSGGSSGGGSGGGGGGGY